MNDNTPATTDRPVSAETLQHVLATGDLSKLSVGQRLEYYTRTCQSLGLNPLTRPLRFLILNGQVQLYATKDCTDQLRAQRDISLSLSAEAVQGDVYTVRAKAKMPNGREDEDIGAVTLPKTPDSIANAKMRAVTKAKRRVTLSICGLGGILDESELDTVPGAKTFDAGDVLPVAEPEKPTTMRDVADKTMRERQGLRYDLEREVLQEQPTLREWFDKFESECAAAQTQDEGEAILKRFPDLQPPEWMADKPNAKARFEKIRQAMVDRLWPMPPSDDDPKTAA